MAIVVSPEAGQPFELLPNSRMVQSSPETFPGEVKRVKTKPEVTG
jgi:hypothetical protein